MDYHYISIVIPVFNVDTKILNKSLESISKQTYSFYEVIILDKKITDKIPVNKLKKLFNFSYHTKRINIIFKRSLKK